MKTTSSLVLLLALGSLTAACAVDAPPEGDPATTREAFVRGGTIGTIGDYPIVVAPLEPAAQGSLVRITSDELDTMLVGVLQQTRIVIDTTRTSPTIYDDFYHCFYPNQQIRESMIAECLQMAGTAKSQCLKMVDEEYPNIKECGVTSGPFHSYIDFGGLAEYAGAEDVGFQGIETIRRDSWGPGSVTIDLNYVRATVNAQTTRAWFAPAPTSGAAANISLKLESNQPTIKCVHSALACPDIELTNMNLTASLTGIRPVVGDPRTLEFDKVLASFTFDRNVNNMPDWMVTLFLDIDALIKNNVQKNVERALGFASSRAALNKALTELATRKAKEKNGSNVDWFYRAWIEGKDTLVVDYQPCPKMGCGILAPVGPVTTR